MRVVIAGSRWIWDRLAVYRAIESFPYPITEVVSGCNRGWDRERKCQIGVDGFGEDWAKVKGIPVKRFPYLKELGKAGGPMRNRRMARYTEGRDPHDLNRPTSWEGGLVLVWDGTSSGSASMKHEGRRLILVERIIHREEAHVQG